MGNWAGQGIDETLSLMMEIGDLLLRVGAETYRVEDTVERVGLAQGMKRVEVIATATGISVTVEDKMGFIRTQVRRIRIRGISLSKLEKVNDLSRRLVTSAISMDDAHQEVIEIDKKGELYPRFLYFMAAGISSGAFALLFNANFVEAGVAFLAGILIHGLRTLTSRWGLTRLTVSFTGGVIAALVGVGAQALLKGVQSADSVIIGAIMILVPGVAITNSIRDVIHEDLLSGVARGAEAILVAIAIAAGVALVLGTWLHLGGGV